MPSHDQQKLVKGDRNRSVIKDKIINAELATPDQLKEIDAKVRKEVDEATKQSKTEPEVGIEELSGDIYCNNIEPLVRGTRPDAPLQHISVASRN